MGLQLKSLTTHLKCMQLVKYHILKYSVDEGYPVHLRSHSTTPRREKAVESCEGTPCKRKTPTLQWVVQRVNWTSRSGFYQRTKVHWPDDKERTQELCIIFDKRYIRRIPTCLLVQLLYGMAKQCRFLGWETVMQIDTGWDRLLYSWSPEMLKFDLNATQDTLPSLANLKTWNKHPLGQCSLCGYNCCTMLHIFNCCQYSLKTARYNWGYDMVLREIVHQLVPAIIKARRPAVDDGDKQSATVPVTGIAFRTDSGNKYDNVAWLGTGKEEIIRDCEDWLVVWDEDKCPAMFPPEIVTISRRPDITIYSPFEKLGIIIELTVPAG